MLHMPVKKSDLESFKTLVERYQTAVYRFCYYLVREPEDAEDLAQEAFITAFNRLESLTSMENFKPWVCSIAYRQFLNQYAKKKHRVAAEADVQEELKFISDINEEIDKGSIEKGDIMHALDKLPLEYRHVLVLRYQEGFSIFQISQSLIKPLATIKTQLYRGKYLLARAIKSLERGKHGL